MYYTNLYGEIRKLIILLYRVFDISTRQLLASIEMTTFDFKFEVYMYFKICKRYLLSALFVNI